MKTIPDKKLITCIIPRGAGSDIVEALHDNKGMITTNISTGRGVSKRAGYFSDEVDVLTVVVGAAQAEDIFEYLYDVLEVDQSKDRLMFQQALGMTTDYSLPRNVESEAE